MIHAGHATTLLSISISHDNYSCLVEVLEEISENGKDGVEAAELSNWYTGTNS